MQKFIPEIWSKKILEELDKQHLLVRKFIPKYKGKNKLIKKLCIKFKIGKYVYPHQIKHIEAGKKIKIKSISEQSLKDYKPNISDQPYTCGVDYSDIQRDAEREKNESTMRR